MRLISTGELTNRTEPELSVLFGMVSKALACTEADSLERRDAAASLENIRRARLQRRLAPAP